MIPQPVPPFWFHQRQCKLEALEEGLFRAVGPNLAEGFLGVRQSEGGHWTPVFRLAKDGPDLSAGEQFDTPKEAWDAAFELYRVNVVV